MNYFSIKDIENLTQIKAHTLRIWEQRYNVLRAKRTTTKIRYYDAEDLKTALRIALLNKHGYKISKISNMRPEEVDDLINAIDDRSFLSLAVANRLLEAMLSFDIELFEAILDQHIREHGLERTVEDVIFQFMEKVGMLWLGNRVMPAQEHLVSNVVYRKVALAIEKTPGIVSARASKMLLFLPEGETHDLGLQYVHYLAKKLGFKVLYLGADAPLSEVKFTYQHQAPEYVYLHLTSVVKEFNLLRYINRLGEELSKATIFVSGQMLRKYRIDPPGNMKFLFSLKDVRETLTGLSTKA